MSTATKALSPKSLAAEDAISQLNTDHVKVTGQFAKYDTARVVPAQIEEEIFYRWTTSNSAH